MPLRRFTDRQIIYGLAFFQLLGISIIIWLSVYSVRKWNNFDEVVKANSLNIEQIRRALVTEGIRPQLVPVPKVDPVK